MSRAELLRAGTGRLRVRPWRDDPSSVIVVPLHDIAPVTVEMVTSLLARLTADNLSNIYTAALAVTDQEPFRRSGFEHYEHLHLLAHDLHGLEAPAPTVRLRRGRRGDRTQLLAVDTAAFEGFWRLDGSGLDDALDATPTARLRVALGSAARGRRGEVCGYAIVGLAGNRGYLQRVAVRPDLQGRGIGRALVLDGLGWLRRRGATRTVVNTQEHNLRALGLYRSLGFVDEPHGLDVLRFQPPGLP